MFFIYLNVRYYPIESVKNCRVSATPNTHVYKLILKITAILSLSLRALTRGSAHSTDPKKYILSPDRTMFLLASRLRRTRTLQIVCKMKWGIPEFRIIHRLQLAALTIGKQNIFCWLIWSACSEFTSFILTTSTSSQSSFDPILATV